jgi:hypothetical protein
MRPTHRVTPEWRLDKGFIRSNSGLSDPRDAGQIDPLYSQDVPYLSGVRVTPNATQLKQKRSVIQSQAAVIF